MTAIHFELNDAILEREPEMVVGGFMATGLQTAASACVDLDGAFKEATDKLSAAGITGQNAVEQPQISSWRRAIGENGISPSRYKSSVEQLVKRVLKKGVVQTPLPLVSLYCAVSAKHLAPLGAYDVSRLSDPTISLRLGRPETDDFSPLGGNSSDMPITEQIVLYGSGDQVICWSYNVRDSRESCLTDETETGIFLGEAVDASQREALEHALSDLKERLAELGAAVGEVSFFDRGRTGGSITSPDL